MKTATYPSIPIDPELLAAAGRVLRDDETLSSFVEQSIREGIACRRLQSKFIARGIASRDEALRTGRYVSSSDVLARLERRLDAMGVRRRHTR
ncbi:YlcI/YnfO family protein [Burkholderia lata]|uniref:YlcI/YnfO family protein n=1 Tax=Burkholderia lata (strain ATCC 17760 / DSM 23089 / LMG 22485 / NCIMB 9086 / R18194 / 383) TaxID=482957 RepID=UPI001582EB26|nr:YlcI/YnfO family protein [Burkholderia lata]